MLVFLALSGARPCFFGRTQTKRSFQGTFRLQGIRTSSALLALLVTPLSAMVSFILFSLLSFTCHNFMNSISIATN